MSDDEKKQKVKKKRVMEINQIIFKYEIIDERKFDVSSPITEKLQKYN